MVGLNGHNEVANTFAFFQKLPTPVINVLPQLSCDLSVNQSLQLRSPDLKSEHLKIPALRDTAVLVIISVSNI